MNYFLIVNLCFLIYFMIFRKRIDLFFLAYISSVVYFSPAFFGVVRYKDRYSDQYINIEENLYYIFLVIQLAIIATSFVYDRFFISKDLIYKKVKEYNIGNVYMFLSLLNILFLILTLYEIKLNIFSSREELMGLYGIFYTLWTYSSILAFVIGWILKKDFKGLFFLSVLSIALHFYLGDRTSIMMGIISICLYEFWNKNILIILVKNKFKVFLVFIFVIFGYMSKVIYSLVRLGEYKLVIDYLFNLDNYILAFKQSEPFVTQMIFNYFVANNISFDVAYLSDLKYQILLFPSNFKEYPSISEIVQNSFFPNISYGVAGNIWAEMFAINGYFSLFLFVILINLFILLLNVMFNNADKVFKGFILVLGAFTCFYIHRNFLESYLTMIRLSSLIFFIAIVLTFILNIIRVRRSI